MTRTALRVEIARTIVLTGAVAVAASGIADAAIPAADRTITGCHKQPNRPPLVVDPRRGCRVEGRMPDPLGQARAGASEPHSVCGFESTFVMNPGIDPTKPTSGTFRSTGGKAVCAGSINGTGTLSYRGRYGPEDTCDAGMGRGKFSFSIGPKTYRGTFVFIRVAMVSQFRGTFQGGGSIFGVTQAFPTRGDCITTPLTEAHSLDQTEVR